MGVGLEWEGKYREGLLWITPIIHEILDNLTYTSISINLKEVDLSCNPNTGFVAYDIIEMAVYILGDSVGLFVKYPMPKTPIDAPIRVFSLNAII